MFALLVAILAAHFDSAMASSTMADAGAITAPPPAPPPPPGLARGLSPAISLFSADDYPVEALRRDEEGLVVAEVDVTPDGRVGACRVVQSSDSLSLDEATCAIMKRRARYRPARDDAGQTVVGHDKVRIKWLMPRNPYRPVTERIEVRYGANGKIAECRYENGIGDQPPCKVMAKVVETLLAAGDDQLALNGRTLIIEHRVEIEQQTWLGVQRQDGLIVMWQQAAEYRLRPDGRLSDCHLIAGKPTHGLDLCREPFDGPYDFDTTGATRPLRTTLSLLSAR